MHRCKWTTTNPIYLRYHDEEWGKPVHDDSKLFEFLILETFQSGLSWGLMLKKRAFFKSAFDNFDYNKVSCYTNNDVERLMQDAGIIRNRLKIKAAVSNAIAFVRIREEFGSFDAYIWKFIKYKTIQPHFETEEQIPTSTPLSEMISKDLKARGFKFCGPTVVYAHMQATGMTNDHTSNCFRYHELLHSK